MQSKMCYAYICFYQKFNISNQDTLTSFKEIELQTISLTSLWKQYNMLGMQNNASMFYLFKFADS